MISCEDQTLSNVFSAMPFSRCRKGGAKMKNMKFIVCWLITVFFSLSGLSNAEAADYCPLHVGNLWTYSEPYGVSANRVDSIIGTDTISGAFTYIWNSQDTNDDNINYEKRWLARDGNDLKMHKYWSNENGGTTYTFTPALTVGKLNPSVGETYSYEADVILDGLAVHVKVTHIIESITDTVTVAAGTFNNCIRIRELSAESTSTGIVTYEYAKYWYAPDVGLVIDREYTENWASITDSDELLSFSIVTSQKAMSWIPLLLNDD